jgi:23S rRNA (adenine1618-N6)-methyltransferase
MTDKKQTTNLHPRNKHQGQYDFKQLVQHNSQLEEFILVNKQGTTSIDFFNPLAVKALNKALLSFYYKIQNWDIPKDYLCPPIPGRADYIHHVADLLASDNNGNIPKGKKIRVLDIGVGANCIYPVIGTKEYGWSFVGSDISKVALKNAHDIILNNNSLRTNIELRWQAKSNQLFEGVVSAKEYFDLSICNPPFHSSAAEAATGSSRKLKNLGQKEGQKPSLNFGGQEHELWCAGGELQFLNNMILQSKDFADSIRWFTSLVSKEAHLKSAYKSLKKVGVTQSITIPMGQGNKKSRILAWSFR